jgi:hypothetical protein
VSITIVAQSATGSPSTGSSPCPHAGMGGAVTGGVVVVVTRRDGPAVRAEPSDTRVESHVIHSPTPTPTTRITTASVAIHPLTAPQPMSQERTPCAAPAGGQRIFTDGQRASAVGGGSVRWSFPGPVGAGPGT